MHPNAQRIQSTLRQHGATGQVIEFQNSTRTSAEAAQAIGTTVAQIAKSLVFMAGDRPILVIASGANRVSTAKVATLYDTEIRRAKAEEVRAATGFPIGGVPPVGLAAEIDIMIDEDLFKFEDVWAAAGTPNAVFPTSPAELATMTGGRIADVKEGGAGGTGEASMAPPRAECAPPSAADQFLLPRGSPPHSEKEKKQEG
jgi:prolyl-tRNA editing enzyme YbaK/EbsC (Cys-tRNA(Pro) deacylase)